MDFTREPIIETIITPKEGYKIVVRNSKNKDQEEYLVDAVQIVTFGQVSFLRSLEKPKPFLVPASDYEMLEVREARMVLKNIGVDRSIKIGGGKDLSRGQKVNDKEGLTEAAIAKEESAVQVEGAVNKVNEERPAALEKKKERRRQSRKRRGNQNSEKIEEVVEQNENDLPNLHELNSQPENESSATEPHPPSFSSLLEPPATLISETISRYRENALFKSAFFLEEDEQYKPHEKVQELLEEDDVPPINDHLLQNPVFEETTSENLDNQCHSINDFIEGELSTHHINSHEVYKELVQSSNGHEVVDLPECFSDTEPFSSQSKDLDLQIEKHQQLNTLDSKICKEPCGEPEKVIEQDQKEVTSTSTPSEKILLTEEEIVKVPSETKKEKKKIEKQEELSLNPVEKEVISNQEEEKRSMQKPSVEEKPLEPEQNR